MFRALPSRLDTFLQCNIAQRAIIIRSKELMYFQELSVAVDMKRLGV